MISAGTGSCERVPRFSNRLSSAMMSLQTSTHSSQMKTVGPAISLRTSFWSLLQNEQRRTSESPFFLTIGEPGRTRAGDGPRAGGAAPCAGRYARFRMTSSMIPYSLPCSGDMM